MTTGKTNIKISDTYYGVLAVHPWVSEMEIRRAYRELSKKYHPDTTELPQAVAVSKFQLLNEAYGILSNPASRALYDLRIGYLPYNVIQPPQSSPKASNSAYLDPTDRPLSSGEIFALFMLGVTIMGCLLLVVVIAIARGDRW